MVILLFAQNKIIVFVHCHNHPVRSAAEQKDGMTLPDLNAPGTAPESKCRQKGHAINIQTVLYQPGITFFMPSYHRSTCAP